MMRLMLVVLVACGPTQADRDNAADLERAVRDLAVAADLADQTVADAIARSEMLRVSVERTRRALHDGGALDTKGERR